MATTTNYSWTTPDDTALVKDGAAAIRTLGSSVDTTVKNLNPETTLGDIAYRSSTANVKTRLGLGTAGQVLTVNSGANAPEWANAVTGGMTLLSTTTLSGATTNITSISQDYLNLYILVTGVTATSDFQLYCRPDGSSNNAVNYLFNSTAQSTTGDWPLTGGSSNTSNDANNAFALDIFNYTSTTTYKPLFWTGYHQLSGGSRYIFGGGGTYINSAIDSFLFYPSAGTFNGGTVKIYGVK
jgi:hypothetical protein